MNEILVSIEKPPFVKIDYLQRFLQTSKKCILELNEKYFRQQRRGRLSLIFTADDFLFMMIVNNKQIWKVVASDGLYLARLDISHIKVKLLLGNFFLLKPSCSREFE